MNRRSRIVLRAGEVGSGLFIWAGLHRWRRMGLDRPNPHGVMPCNLRNFFYRPGCVKLREAGVAVSRRKLICAVFMVVALTTTTGCQASAGSGQVPPQELSTVHRELALAAAHQDANQIAVGRNDQQVSGWPSGISAVTAVVRPGTVSDSNTGHTCESGDIISVQLVGAFDTVTTGTTSSPDTTVREIDLSVDATTGLTCLISVRTEPVAPGPGAVVLYSR